MSFRANNDWKEVVDTDDDPIEVQGWWDVMTDEPTPKLITISTFAGGEVEVTTEEVNGLIDALLKVSANMGVAR